MQLPPGCEDDAAGLYHAVCCNLYACLIDHLEDMGWPTAEAGNSTDKQADRMIRTLRRHGALPDVCEPEDQ